MTSTCSSRLGLTNTGCNTATSLREGEGWYRNSLLSLCKRVWSIASFRLLWTSGTGEGEDAFWE